MGEKLMEAVKDYEERAGMCKYEQRNKNNMGLR